MRGQLYILWILVALTVAPVPVQAGVRDLTHQGMRDVVKISRAIAMVQPRLEEHKYLQYAMGIYQASKKYSIEPSVIIAITQQETGFRENLPEGAAGERGICQILKNWLKNPKFKAEFRKFQLKDFSNPSKSFLVAAWILKDLKTRTSAGSLPYWSYYNATKFHNRFKYFLAVNKYVAIMKKYEHQLSDRAIAALDGESDQHDIAFAKPVANEETEQAVAAMTASTANLAPGAKIDSGGAAAPVAQPVTKVTEDTTVAVQEPKKPAAQPTLQAQVAAPLQRPRPQPVLAAAAPMVPVVPVAPRAPSAAVPSAQMRLTQSAQAQPEVTVPRPGPNGKTYWIPDALRKVQRNQKLVANDGSKVISPAIMRAASELDVQGVYFDGPYQD